MFIHRNSFYHALTAIREYSSVPNRRIGPNQRAGGKILKKH